MLNRQSGARAERWVLGRILRAAGEPPVRLVLPDGFSAEPRRPAPWFTLRIGTWRALLAMALDPETGFAEGYASGEVTLDGPLAGFCDAVYAARAVVESQGWFARLVSAYLEWTQRRSLSGARRNIHRHYDLGNDFYQLWLDQDLIYTCAFFPSAQSSLEQAQAAKMDRVARKLALERGERVVEAGCGWGSLAIHLARHYGVRVRAFNISREQITYARARARREGVEAQVEYVEDDYRNITGRYDAFVSVGMLEHVGREHYGEMGEVIGRSIGEEGRGLLHFIGRARPAPLSPWIRQRIFPGAYAPVLSEALPLLEQRRYTVADVENLRAHYARTLHCWLERFEAAWPQVSARYGEEFARAWRLYLAGSEAAFRSGSLQLYQVLFAGPRCAKRLWTREAAGQEQAAASG